MLAVRARRGAISGSAAAGRTRSWRFPIPGARLGDSASLPPRRGDLGRPARVAWRTSDELRRDAFAALGLRATDGHATREAQAARGARRTGNRHRGPRARIACTEINF